LLNAVQIALNNTGIGLNQQGLRNLLRYLAPDVNYLWNPFTIRWGARHLTALAKVLTHLGLVLRVTPDDSSSSFTFAASNLRAPVFLDVRYTPGANGVDGHYYCEDDGDTCNFDDDHDHYTNSSPANSSYGNWLGSGKRNCPTTPAPARSAPSTRTTSPTPSPVPANIDGPRTTRKIRRKEFADVMDVTPAIVCSVCKHEANSEIAARGHVNKHHLGNTMSSEWTVAASAARCDYCTKYFAAYKSGANIGMAHAHSCAAKNQLLPNHRDAKLSGDTLTIPDGIFVIEECGATLKRGTENLVARCFFLAAARAHTATRATLQGEALKLHEETLRLLKTDETVRGHFPPNVIAALCPSKNGVAKTLDDLIAKFEQKGYADDPIIVAAAIALGRTIEIWERNASGQIVVNTIAPPGTTPLLALRVWRVPGHYKALVPEARVQRAPTQPPPQQPPPRPPNPTPTTPTTTNRTKVKEWKTHITGLFTAYGAPGTSLEERRLVALQLLLTPPVAAKKKIETHELFDDDEFDPGDNPLDPPRPAPPSTFSSAIMAASKELRSGHVSRALNKLFSAGVLALDESTQAKLTSKYPDGGQMDVDPDEDAADIELKTDVVTFTVDQMLQLIKSKSPLTGAGYDGWCYRQLKDLIKSIHSDKTPGIEESTLSGLHLLLLDIANGRLNTPTLRPLLTTLRGIALRKRAGSDDVRPIGIGQLFTNIAGTLAVRSLSDTAVREGVGPTDWMHRTSGGVEALVHFTRAYLLVNATHVVAKTDVENAFNSVGREHVLKAAQTYPALVPLASMLYGAPNDVVFSDDNVTFTIKSKTGVTQGEPFAALLYSTALKEAVDATLAQHPSITVRGIADDRHFFGPLDDVLAALDTYKIELAKSGQNMQREKTTIYSPQGMQHAAAACAARGYAAATGLRVGGAPIGDASYVQSCLAKFVDGVEDKCARIMALFGVQKLTGVQTQDFYRILRWCLTPAAINHLLRTVPPDDIRVHAMRFDDVMYKFFIAIIGVDPDDADVNPATPNGDLTAARARLSAAAGGLGITSAASTTTAAYLGSLCLTTHYAKQALGDGPVDAAQLANAFPLLATAVRGGNFSAIPNLAGASLPDIAEEQFSRVQRKLTREVNKNAFTNIFSRVVDPEAKAWLLSGQKNGATFLVSYPEFGGGLSDIQFVTLVKARLGLRVLKDTGDNPQQCPACSGLKANGSGTLRPEMTVLRADGIHALHCREKGKGGLSGMTSARHQHLKFSVVNIIKRYGSKTTIVHDTEPVIADFYPIKDNQPAVRGDIAVTTNGITTILDTVVSHPHAAREPRVARIPGFAAGAAHLGKMNLYSKTYDIPSGHMVPLSAETGGHLHDGFKTYIKSIIEAGLAVGGAPEPLWTPALRTEFSSRLQTAFVTINLAIARSVAIALIRGSVIVERYAPPARGALGG
jgi:hypothetical protein